MVANRRAKKARNTKRPAKGKRGMRSKRNPNNIGGPNTCKVIETLPTIPIAVNTPYLISKLGITGLRAPEIAKQFGLYRIASLKFVHKPIFDTYAQTAAIAPASNIVLSVPNLYWKMNRYGDFPANFDGDYMRALGARANRLDDKNVRVGYKPNILTDQGNSVGSSSAGIKMTPWLSTDDTPNDNNFTLSTAKHYGHTLFVEASLVNTSTTPNVCSLDIEVVYEFKNPRVVRQSSTSPAAQGLSF